MANTKQISIFQFLVISKQFLLFSRTDYFKCYTTREKGKPSLQMEEFQRIHSSNENGEKIVLRYVKKVQLLFAYDGICIDRQLFYFWAKTNCDISQLKNDFFYFPS